MSLINQLRYIEIIAIIANVKTVEGNSFGCLQLPMTAVYE